MEATSFKNTQKQILIAVGTVSLVIGVIGLVVPLLPGVPFLLFAEFCLFSITWEYRSPLPHQQMWMARLGSGHLNSQMLQL